MLCSSNIKTAATRRGGWVAESNSLLNCRTGNRTAGSNPALSAIFVLISPQTVPFSTVWGFHLVKTDHFQLYPGIDRGHYKSQLKSDWTLTVDEIKAVVWVGYWISNQRKRSGGWTFWLKNRNCFIFCIFRLFNNLQLKICSHIVGNLWELFLLPMLQNSTASATFQAIKNNRQFLSVRLRFLEKITWLTAIVLYIIY